MKIRNFTNFVLLCMLLFPAGCTSIGKEQAEFQATRFIQDRVKFFSNEENQMQDIPSYNITQVTSYEEGGIWTVVLHIESVLDNSTKDNDLEVKINRKGKVIEFNGRTVT
jgi:hypothetical protein